MKHTPLHTLESVATVSYAGRSMTPRERLARWADVLEREPDKALKPLTRVELYAEPERSTLRGDQSPLSVAFADPVLRAEGLSGDRLGDGRGFFGLTNSDIHALVCDCRYGGRMRSGDVGRRVRALAHPNPVRRFLARLQM
ncbi:MAG: hypothetical protein ACREEW_10930 [Caulobacteraceae bacterium]